MEIVVVKSVLSTLGPKINYKHCGASFVRPKSFRQIRVLDVRVENGSATTKLGGVARVTQLADAMKTN